MSKLSKQIARKGFTLVELLVVIAIIGILVALLLPAIQAAREAARRNQCLNNLKQFALGCVNYESAHGMFPRGAEPGMGHYNENSASWMFQALAYTEQNSLYDQIMAAGSFNDAAAQGLLPAHLPMARCPSDGWERENATLHNYICSTGPTCNNPPSGYDSPFQLHCNGKVAQGGRMVPPALDPPTHRGYGPSATHGDALAAGDILELSLTVGMFVRGGTAIRAKHVSDGLSNTLLLGETLPESSEFQWGDTGWGWASGGSTAHGQTIQPLNWRIEPVPSGTPWGRYPCTDRNRCLWNWAVTWGFKSHHPGGANFALADGSVRFLNDSIDHELYQYLGCRNDGRSVSLP